MMKYYSIADILSSHDITKEKLRRMIRTGNIKTLKLPTCPSHTKFKYVIPADELLKLAEYRVNLPKPSEDAQPGYYEAIWEAERVRKEKIREERKREAQRVEYHAYMETEAWRRVRNAAFKRDGYRCQMCGSGKNLEGHHTSYERLGKKGEVDDVIALCRYCHAKVHETDQAKKAQQHHVPSIIEWSFDAYRAALKTQFSQQGIYEGGKSHDERNTGI